MWRENVSLPQLLDATRMISFAAKWQGQSKVHFHSEHHDAPGDATRSHALMVTAAFNLLNEADAVVHYNGVTFDVPHLNREFLLDESIGVPPAPFQQIDLLATVRKRFRFASNKLDHITKQLGQVGKVRHTGFDMWRDCLNGDERAWSLMRRYNKADVTELEKVYDRLLPWIVGHPHMGLYSDAVHLDPDTGKPVEVHMCDKCMSTNLRREGHAYTRLGKFQRYQCRDCGAWSRGRRSVARVDARGTL